MVKRNRDVSARYSEYCHLVNSNKVTDHEFIYLKPGSNSHKRYKFGREYIYFEPKGEPGSFQVRQPLANASDYSFSVFCEDFVGPIFRFDAQGPTHTNQADPSLGLPERVISLPHFHRYNERGVMEAYRTKEIEDKETELLNDINKGLDCFCRENKIRSSSNGRLFVIEQLELFEVDEPVDLHKGIDFP